MTALFLPLLFFCQDPSADVGRFVQEGAYADALVAASGAEEPERSLLFTWTRHHAGDLYGALAEATTGLAAHPEHVGLLEQAAWISASLHRAEESMGYAERLEGLGHPTASAFVSDARELLDVKEEVSRAQDRANILLAAFALLAVSVSAWGARAVSS
ncbi:MAG: hypothetical protein CMK00_02190 [Planctomycetes bacterium]|nr:hypothetical protein [Planctomycetota bacterium]